MKTSEVRAGMYFPKELYEEIQKEAQKENISISEFVRESVIERLTKKRKRINWDNDPILDLVGIAPGPSDASVNHDRYIYGRKKA